MSYPVTRQYGHNFGILFGIAGVLTMMPYVQRRVSFLTWWLLGVIAPIVAMLLAVLLVSGCASTNRHIPKIVGRWEYLESTSDLGNVHMVWLFTSDGKTESIITALSGKNKMSDQGTYLFTSTNLTFYFNKWGSDSYGVEHLDDNSLKVRHGSSTVEFKRIK
ncbi:MAG: hypothetical protein WCO51_13125 [bacterium]